MQVIDELLAFFTDNDLTSTLNPPADEADIQALEAAFGHPLPASFKALYRRFDGQRRTDGAESEDRFLPLSEMLAMHQHWQNYLRDHYGDDWRSLTPGESDNDGVIANVLFHRDWLPFMTNGGDITCLDFAPGQIGERGQVITAYIGDDIYDYTLEAESPDFAAWLEDYLGMLNGDFQDVIEDIIDSFAEPEYSSGGSRIYRHEDDPERDITVPDDIQIYGEEIEGHYEHYFGDIGGIYHEIVSDIVHIDIHMIPPSTERPWYTLATIGMSDLPMHVPAFDGNQRYTRAELLIYLPPDWPLKQEDFDNEDNYWPLRWLKILARLPHEYETWLGEGHTIPNGDPPEPIANTPFSGFLLLPPLLSQPEEAYTLQTTDGEIIRFYCVIPLYTEEMDYKLEHGVSELLGHFDTDVMDEIVDIHRPCMVPEKAG
ncbi:MAG: suppressor of fused domain protein [Cardiobacteriaceae bacterium]|nr:suppressor of fused domain protein [Cardiobacteriaceae bacterium]